jgi:hypothetical protein
MKIRVIKYVADDKFFVDIKNEEFSQDDLAAMQKFGEPQVDVGGFYGNVDDDTTSTWTLPDRYVYIRKGFQPFTFSFDGGTYSNAAARSSALAAILVTRITTALTTLRALSDTFSGEAVTNV